MKLQMLSFRGDNILDRRIKEASNYCDNSHIYAATFGVCRIVLAELSPIDLDGHKMLSIIANVEQQITGKPGYNYDTFFKESFLIWIGIHPKPYISSRDLTRNFNCMFVTSCWIF